ncbi:Helix-turn-helix domain-containing protein [Streptococcus gallolyticus]|uniref:Helix-turn-helix domain-containing protein n=1 Tax=Streptococcus gallolyticus TaxID=315405 RepID=A0A1H7VYX5_9STRE|nr:XRE family transcriptional regulator [Streptococcus gallolyticus]MCY7172739.1 helix-turn-helix domain-containing protein [Streptococcus gallolyticus subsp. gallolyticus]MCY7188263.1 helix-turn-helix domain-containing protein [Streptococcus gallolyticus subsp. gallolyticus]SDK16368.1 Helix-turn-helix domain-containing protein [Streptococcus gallolyticus]SDL65635.1 Helix-turn-helix domain-containing protein [Streptococcus gallolyticus]SEF22951.1 Helix-turn-helix domain-containing protein [Str
MDFKKEFGQKVRDLRKEKGMSRQRVCGIEDVLTTRQLQRIEKGQSLPTIATAVYIADKLGVSLDSLINKEGLKLPKGYINLRYQLRTLYHYGDKDRLLQREKIIEQIYEYYFDDLPEEEQIAVQVAQASVDMICTRNASFDQGLLDEYLGQACKKSQLSFNDVEIIQLRLLSLAIKDFDKVEFVDLLSKVILAVSYFPLADLGKIQDVIISAAGILCCYGEYNLLPDVIEVLRGIMRKRNDYRDNIFVYAFEWKIALFLKHDLEKARKDYQKSIMMADLLSEDLIKQNMQREWKKDLEYFGLDRNGGIV